MDKVIECTRALGEAITASPAFAEMKLAEDGMAGDPAAAAYRERLDTLKTAHLQAVRSGNGDAAVIYAEMEDLQRLYAPTVFGKAACASGMTQFEKEADNAVRDYVMQSGFIAFGQEVLVEYLSALENEITSLRIILTGKRMGIPEAKLRERLRESYV